MSRYDSGMSRDEIWGELSDEEKADVPPRRRPSGPAITGRFATPRLSEEAKQRIANWPTGDNGAEKRSDAFVGTLAAREAYRHTHGT